VVQREYWSESYSSRSTDHSHYYLQQCYEEIPTFQSVAPMTIRTSFKSLRLGLYDEEQTKLIGFRALRFSRRAASG
jgi:hypothetical protein